MNSASRLRNNNTTKQKQTGLRLIEKRKKLKSRNEKLKQKTKKQQIKSNEIKTGSLEIRKMINLSLDCSGKK